MSGTWIQLGVVAVLVLINAAFAGSELALVSLREGQLRRLEAESRRGAVLARLARDPNRFLATIQVGITLAGFLASASAAVSLAVPLEGPLEPLGAAARPVSIVLVTLALSYVTLVVGELAPKRIAMQRAERWGLVVARPLAAISAMARPVIWLLSRSTDLVVRLLGGDPDLEREEVTEAELRELVDAHASFSEQQRRIIVGAFEVSDRTVQQILRPRPDVFALTAEQPCEPALAALAASGHTRAPVGTAGSLDEIVGVVHLRDLLDGGTTHTVGDVVSEAMFVPESAPVLDTLRRMQDQHAQMAIVVNEHGGTEGIVTIEDIVEELVGEIYDEADQDILEIHRLPDGSLVLPGRFPVHDLDDLGIDVPAGDYTTVAGLVLDELQRLPDRPGDVVTVGDWRFQVTGVRARSITEVKVRRENRVEPEK